MKAGPRPPASKISVISGHAGRQMLEVADGVSDEKIIFSVGKIPNERRVWGWLIRDH
jgi:hypothetical protein